jgi:hypothetical protein
MEEIVVAILAKDKEYCLDFYLNCILNQTYDKKKIHLYIRTNDNKDNTQTILDNFIKTHVDEYASIYYDNSSVSETLKNYNEHEWTSERFKILGKLRQDSIDYAIQKKAHYFIADCDNFITKDTVEHFYNLKHLNFTGPMLKLAPEHMYANFHNEATEYGYFADNDQYIPILHRKVQGLIKVDTLHCTYFINNKILNDITYDDGTERYEYAILADTLRKKEINQYMDNTKFFGFLFLNDQIETSFKDFISTHWEHSYNQMKNNE